MIATIKYNRYILINPVYILNFIFCIGLIFFGNQRLTWPVYDLMIIFLLYFFLSTKVVVYNKIRYHIVCTLLSTIVVLYVLNLIVNDISVIRILKFYNYIKHFVLIIFFVQVLRRDKRQILQLLQLLYWILLIQFLLNVPYIYYQYMLRPWDIDNLTGFFGEGATHNAGFFWLLLISLHLIFKKNIVLLFVLLILMLLLAAISSNIFFFISLPLIFMFYYIKWIKIKSLLKFFGMMLGMIGLFIYLMNNSIIFENFYQNRLRTNIYSYIFKATEHEYDRNKNLGYALNDKNSYFVGNGAGEVSEIIGFEGNQYMKKIHMFINDAIQLIYEFGLLFYFLLVLLYTIAIDSLFLKRNITRFMFIAFILIGLTYYHGIFSIVRDIYPVILIFLSFAYYHSDNNLTYSILGKMKLN